MNTIQQTKKLDGKVAVVTGASKGIGAAIAKQLAAEGASVVVNYASSKAAAEKVVSEITAQGGRAVAVQADVAKKADIERLFAEAHQAFGKTDILVNNAGVYEFAPIEQFSEEQFHRQFNLNVLGLLLTTQAAVKQFDSAGGSVINISSVVGINPLPNASVYSATKAAVRSFARTWCVDLKDRKIRVNAISPGVVPTPGYNTSLEITQEQVDQFVQSSISGIPLGRPGTTDEIAKAVLFLASDDSSYVNGIELFVDGGLAQI